MPSLLWRLDAVTVPGRRTARLDLVSVEIPVGITAVLGPSGAGKSTLLNLLVGFEKPRSGTVTWLGDDLRSPHSPSADIRHSESAGYEIRERENRHRLPVFWAPPGHGLWPQISVRDHLASILPNDVAAAQADRLLAAFDLTPLAKAYPGTLSQGERDRLSLARAIVSDARALVLDEPLVHVPAEAALRYWTVLRSECRERMMSVVMATHDPEVARREANWIIRLAEGRLTSAAAQELQ